MVVVVVVAQERPWSDIPAVQLVGVAIGLVVVVAAIRFWFKRK